MGFLFSLYLCHMTATALFRRFLNENGVRKEFENEWRLFHEGDTSAFRLKWTNDFLSHYVIDVLHRGTSGYWQFLSPRRVIDWETTKSGWDHWNEIDIRWVAYFKANENKISPYIPNSYAGD